MFAIFSIPSARPGFLSRRSILLIVAFLASLGQGWSAEYFINNSAGNNTNSGTAKAPFKTIQRGADIAKAGDTVFVLPGLYDERVSPKLSGAVGNPVTFSALGPVVVRGFVLNSKSFIRIANFEITHTPTNQYSGIELLGAHGAEILDNNIHNTGLLGIWLKAGSPSSNVVIRGNKISFTGVVQGKARGEIAVSITGTRVLAEYNELSHVADFFNCWGTNNVIRNNFMHDCYLSDTPDYSDPQGWHIDGLQFFSTTVPLVRNLMENNFILRNDVPHGHGIIFRDTATNASSGEFIFRRNVMARNGSYAAVVEGFDNLRIYNNTYSDILNQQATKDWTCIGFSGGATGGKIINNIFNNASRVGGSVYRVEDDSTNNFYADYNQFFLSGPPVEQNRIMVDPQFSDKISADFRLAPTSGAIGTGGPLTKTVAAGSGTSVPVQDAGYFSDGWTIVEGDVIRVGNNEPAQIVAIDYTNNVLTVDRSLTWEESAWVNLAFSGDRPDRGALPFRPNGYNYSISLDHSPVTSDTNNAIELTALVSDPTLVRSVQFLVDGLPKATIRKGPYTWTWRPARAGRFTVQARAYSYFADSNNVRVAETRLSPGLVSPPHLREVGQ